MEQLQEDVQWLLRRRTSLVSEARMLASQLNDTYFEIRRIEEALKQQGAYPDQGATK